MKFKLLYDDWTRTHPLKRRNQLVIPSSMHKNNNNDIANEYEINLEDENSDENDSKISIDFTNIFTKFFNQSQLQKQEKEIIENMEKLNIQPEVFLSPLFPEQLLEDSTKCFEISKSYMLSKTISYFYQDKKVKREVPHNIS
jgi:hypothetical protein